MSRSERELKVFLSGVYGENLLVDLFPDGRFNDMNTTSRRSSSLDNFKRLLSTSKTIYTLKKLCNDKMQNYIKIYGQECPYLYSLINIVNTMGNLIFQDVIVVKDELELSEDKIDEYFAEAELSVSEDKMEDTIKDLIKKVSELYDAIEKNKSDTDIYALMVKQNNPNIYEYIRLILKARKRKNPGKSELKKFILHINENKIDLPKNVRESIDILTKIWRLRDVDKSDNGMDWADDVYNPVTEFVYQTQNKDLIHKWKCFIHTSFLSFPEKK